MALEVDEGLPFLEGVVIVSLLPLLPTLPTLPDGDEKTKYRMGVHAIPHSLFVSAVSLTPWKDCFQWKLL